MGRLSALSTGLGLAPFFPRGAWHLDPDTTSPIVVAVADERTAELVRQHGLAITVTEVDGATAVHHVRKAVVQL